MKKEQFILELRSSLAYLSADEVNEVIRDQEEYIRDAIAAGRSEEEVIESLGAPKQFAANLHAETQIQKAENAQSLKKQMGTTLGAVLAILALAPLNLIFVLGPFLGLSGALFGGWGAAIGILSAAFAVLGLFFFKLIFVSVGFWTHLSALFFLLGLLGLGALGFVFMLALTKIFLSATLRYLKWNLNFIKGRA